VRGSAGQRGQWWCQRGLREQEQGKAREGEEGRLWGLTG
jgi:hypothetical protein